MSECYVSCMRTQGWPSKLILVQAKSIILCFQSHYFTKAFCNQLGENIDVFNNSYSQVSIKYLGPHAKDH